MRTAKKQDAGYTSIGNGASFTIDTYFQKIQYGAFMLESCGSDSVVI